MGEYEVEKKKLLGQLHRRGCQRFTPSACTLYVWDLSFWHLEWTPAVSESLREWAYWGNPLHKTEKASRRFTKWFLKGGVSF